MRYGLSKLPGPFWTFFLSTWSYCPCIIVIIQNIRIQNIVIILNLARNVNFLMPLVNDHLSKHIFFVLGNKYLLENMFLYPFKIKAEYCTQLPLKAPQMQGCFAAKANLEGSRLRGHAPSDFSFTNMPEWGKSRALQNNMFVDWCKEHFLELNVKKTKELIFDFRQTNNSHYTM